MRFHFLILCFCFYFPAHAQVADSLAADSAVRQKVLQKKIYSIPRKASIMSALLPGLGQIYNRKYWKAPVIYAGLGACAYVFASNQAEFKYYQKNLRAEADNDPNTINETFYGTYELQQLKIQYRRLRDFGAMGIGIIYVLNIIDANVDGHLRTFDVSDDLSLQLMVKPLIWQSNRQTNTGAAFALKLTFN